jgi:hypothetical protein
MISQLLLDGFEKCYPRPDSLKWSVNGQCYVSRCSGPLFYVAPSLRQYNHDFRVWLRGVQSGQEALLKVNDVPVTAKEAKELRAKAERADARTMALLDVVSSLHEQLEVSDCNYDTQLAEYKRVAKSMNAYRRKLYDLRGAINKATHESYV